MSKQKNNELEGRLAIDELNRKIEQLNQSMPILESLAKGSKELKDQVTNEITKYALSIRASRLDKTELNNFFDHPYHLFKQKGDNDNSWHLAIPRFIDAQFGWLEKVTESHNIFVVNPYVDWLGEIPDALKQKIGMKDPLDVYLDGNSLRGKDIEKIKMKMSPFITRAEKDRLIIDKSRHFELLAALIKENILPFVPKPVDQDDLYEKPRFKEDFELRDYHYEAWYTFKKYSNIGYFLPPSGGKTFLSMYALGYVKGPNLICVPSKQLKEQWIARIETYTTLRVSDEIKDDIDVVVMTYQSAIKKAHKIQWSLMVIDEVHHLPANLFSKLATLSRKYLIGLTATPQREDDREEYIFALTGKPCGLSWQKMKELGIIKNPDLHVWIVKNESERWNQLDNLMNNYPGQSIIFSDSIKKGETAAKRYNLKFVHGSGKIGVKDIPKGETFVCSRVGDEGISLPQIKRVIEIDWLHGCYDSQTEVLTDNGWKLFSNISYDDNIATLNNEGFLEYNKPLDIQNYYYKGKMVQFGGFHSSYDLLVTPDHRMYVKPSWNEDFKFKRADEIPIKSSYQYELKKNCKWNGIDLDYFELPKIIPKDYRSSFRLKQIEKIPIDLFLRVLAWYLAEGSTSHNREVKITQLKEKNRLEIFDLFKKCGFNPYITYDSIRISSKQLTLYLKQFGTAENKFIPGWVKQLKTEKLRIFIETIMKGDGSGSIYYTSSKQLADDIQEIGIKANYATSLYIRNKGPNYGKIRGREIKTALIQYEISLTEKSSTPQIFKRPENVDYEGRIYDVTVPNHILMVRRNGKAVWSGNSRRQELQRFTRILHGKNIEGVGHIIMTLDQYTTDRKRLFGIMEKGFKIVLHREGYSDKEIIEATYNKPKRNGNRKPRQPTSKVNSGPENSKSHLIEEVSKLNPVLQGAKKALLNNLNSNELECLRIMFANPHIKYTKEKLHGIIKKGRVRDFASFKKMETLGFITKVDKIEYQAKLD